MKKLMLTFAILVIFTLYLSADTYIPAGDVSGTWELIGSPFYIEGEISIPVGETLTIEPGVEVIFNGHYKFLIYGYLEAIGDSLNYITFTAANTTEGWHSLRFIDAPDASHLSYCIIEYGKATGAGEDSWGGGVFCDNSDPIFNYCTIQLNEATQYGGGMMFQESSLSIINCTITENQATAEAGISIYGNCEGTIDNSVISNNQATQYAGGISCVSNSDVNFLDTQFLGNTSGAGWNGGGLYISTSDPDITNCTFSGNYSGYDGGAIRITYNSNPIIDNCTFTGNTAEMSGGGIACEESNPQILNCTITNNHSLYSGPETSGGGGFGCLYSNPLISNCTIRENTANNPGGGIAFAHSDGVIEYCDIMGNTTEHSGGGIACFNSIATISYCLITYNNAIIWEGGGIDAWDYSNFTVMNCTVSGNDAGGNGGGIKCSSSSDMTMVNTIIEGNTGSEGVYFYEPGNVDITYSDFYNNVVGDFGGNVPPDLGIITTVNANDDPCDDFMNIFLDPLFVDPANGDYHILVDSPCIDAGDPDSPPNPNGSIADIGRFYFGETGTEDNTIVQANDYLKQNYPNPFNPETTINYQLPENSKVELTVYNLKGQKVKQLVRDRVSAGQHSAIWNGKDDNGKTVSSGIYFYKMKTENYEETKKMILLK